MTDNDVFALMDQHLAAEYDLPDELDNLKKQVEILSGKVDAQAEQITTLTSDRNELLKLISIVAEAQGIEVRVEL